jgi:ATP-dependent Clp protease protease subunit
MGRRSEPDVLAALRAALVGAEMEEKFLERREVFLWGEVCDESAEEIVKKILFLDGAGDGDITMYINSPGGVISSGLAIYDAMRRARSDIATVVMGQAASMSAVLLCAGDKGKRCAWEHARVLIHQPLISGNMYGPASDIQIQAEEMLRTRENLNRILAEHTGQTLQKITEDTDRDYFMSAGEAKDYGIVDRIGRV